MDSIKFIPNRGETLSKLILDYANSNNYENCDGDITTTDWSNALNFVESEGIVQDTNRILANQVIEFTPEQIEQVVTSLGLQKQEPDSSTFIGPMNNNLEILSEDEPTIYTEESLSENIEIESTDWRQLNSQYHQINQLPSSHERVVEFYKQFMPQDGDNYVVVDKPNARLEVRRPNGEIVESYEVGLGKDKGDQYVTKERRMTTAGIYTIDAQANGRDAYRRLYGTDIFTMETDKGHSGVAIHRIPRGNRSRAPKHDNGTLDDNRYSLGCINLLPSEFNELEELIGVGTKVYVLPEDEGNEMVVKNGQLNFVQDDFDGTVLTSLPCTDSRPVSVDICNSDYDSETTREFADALANNKPMLMRDIGLDNDTYNELAELALGIAGQESEYGEGYTYWLKEKTPAVNVVKWLERQWGNMKNTYGIMRLFRTHDASFVGSGNSQIKHSYSFNSRGLTQMKLPSYTDEDVVALLEQYNISEDDLGDPSKSATATMIVLGSMVRNELPGLEDQIESLGLTNQEALLYLWQGKKSQITNRTATPDESSYIVNVKDYMNSFTIEQSQAVVA